jgi:hypothetical protein
MNRDPAAEFGLLLLCFLISAPIIPAFGLNNEFLLSFLRLGVEKGLRAALLQCFPFAASSVSDDYQAEC